MQKIARRMFCGAAIAAFPLLRSYSRGADFQDDSPDFVLDTLADEIARITADGAENGFRAEHFRRYAGVIRTFDAHLEDKGTNGEVNKKLDEDDAHRMDPAAAARVIAEYWKKKGLVFNEDDLTASLTIDSRAYGETKRAIKRQGGVRMIHKAVAEVFERKAKEAENAAFRGGPAKHNGRIFVGNPGASRQPEFMAVQFDYTYMNGTSVDCLCKAMVTEGVLLTMACLLCPGCQALCVPAGIMLAIEKLMEAMATCMPQRCA